MSVEESGTLEVEISMTSTVGGGGTTATGFLQPQSAATAAKASTRSGGVKLVFGFKYLGIGSRIEMAEWVRLAGKSPV
jgi:hypothetical protein